MRLFLVPLIAAGYAFGLVTGATELVKSGTQPPRAAPTAIVWADRVFGNKQDLAAWLKARGSSYAAWAARYPAAARSVEALPPKQSAPRTTSEERDLSVTRPRATGADHTALAIGILLASVLGLLALAVVVRASLLRAPLHLSRLRVLSRLSRGRPRPTLPTLPRLPHPRRVAAPAGEPARATAVVVAPTPVKASAPATAVAVAPMPVKTSAPPRVAHVGMLMQKSFEASRGAWARLEQRRRAGFHHREEELQSMAHEPLLFRETVSRNLPDLAMIATSVLLACVIGASIALYLK